MTGPRILLDACVPQRLRRDLAGFDVTTARFARLDQLPDRELIATAEQRFDILVTLDRNLPFQQSLRGRTIAMIVLRLDNQTPEAMSVVLPALRRAIRNVKPGEVRGVG